jgi:hypothetical protein
MEFQDQQLSNLTQQCLTEAEEEKRKEYLFGIGDKSQGLLIKNVVEVICKKKALVVEIPENVGVASEGVINLVPRPEVFVKVTVLG